MKSKCEKCGQKRKLTADHIIPRWLIRRVHLFGINVDVPEERIQKICADCNQEKGGLIDYVHPTSREFLKRFATEILKKLES